MSRPVKPAPMCFVSIGRLEQLLMPVDDGMKLVKLLQTAVECERNYGERGFFYVPLSEELNVEFALVRANQLCVPKTADKSPRATTLLLENDQ